MLFDFSRLEVLSLEKKDIRKLADDFRKQYSINNIPIDVELITEKNLGLYLVPLKALRLNSSAEAFLSGNLEEIIYDPHSPKVRLRFSIAHEIGHFVLHKEIISKINPESFEDFKDVQSSIPINILNIIENQAREFAGRLLVPREFLLNELNKFKYIMKIIKYLPSLIKFPLLSIFIIPTLSYKFSVSKDVIRRRLYYENIFNQTNSL